MSGGTPNKRVPKRRAKTAGPTVNRVAPPSRAGGGGGGVLKSRHTSSARPPEVTVKKIDVRFGNKEGGGTHFGSEERFTWQKAKYASDAMYTMPAVKAPPFSFGTSTRADWKKIMENTKDLHNPNGELCESLFVDCAPSYIFFNHLRHICLRGVCDARVGIEFNPRAAATCSTLLRCYYRLTGWRGAAGWHSIDLV